MKKMLALLAFLALVAVACSFSIGNGGKSEAPTAAPSVSNPTRAPAAQPTQAPTKPAPTNAPAPTNTPVPSPTSAPTNTAAPTNTPVSKTLFKDDFSDKNSGWDQVRADDGVTDYEDGVYRIFVNVPKTDIWANPGKNFSGDLIVEVDAVKAAGPDDNDFGVICRYQDSSNYYFFVISSDGYAGIGKVDHDSQILLNKGGQMVPVGIPTGTGVKYHIKVSCIGSQLTLNVNGKDVLTAQDATFTSGDVGLLAGTFDKGGVDIRFDNFLVQRP